MHSIRVKITAVTLAAVLTSILLLGGIGIWNIQKDSDETSVEKMNMICENMQQKLDAYFSSLQQSVDMGIRTAKDSLKGADYMLFSTELDEAEQAELDRTMAAHSAEVEKAFTSIAHVTNGIVTYYYCINDELGSSEHGFFWSRMEDSDFVMQAPLISSELDPKDTEHTTWYYSPIKNGSPTWIGPYKAHFLKEALTLSYVAPIYYSGFLIGVMGMDILFDTITEQIATLKVYDSGYAFLMDRQATILYHPQYPAGTTLAKLAISENPEELKRSSNGDSLIRFMAKGQERQLSFATLRNKLKLGVIAPVSEITASQRRLTMAIVIVAAVMTAVFAVVMLVVVNALTKPLLNLAAASRELEKGNYDVELDYNSKDEVGTLTRSFRQMRDHLRFTISDLNSRAYTDAMTGIRNKGAFTLSVSQLNSEMHREGEEPAFGFVMFDCNSLKEINDEYGHEQGDSYLKATCRIICRVFAHSPVFRLGGDEFGVILQGEDYGKRERLMSLFERMVEAENRAAENPWDQVSVAKGMSVYRPGEDRNAEEVLARADQRMYEDKKQYHE